MIFNSNKTNAVTIAPGEGRTPRSIYYDPDCVELSFPTLFGGQKRDNRHNFSYQQIAKFENLVLLTTINQL